VATKRQKLKRQKIEIQFEEKQLRQQKIDKIDIERLLTERLRIENEIEKLRIENAKRLSVTTHIRADHLKIAGLAPSRSGKKSLAAPSVPLLEEAHQHLGLLVRIVARAIEVLGTSEKALRWINTPIRSLGDQTPLSLLSTPEGIERVEEALGRIEHGVW